MLQLFYVIHTTDFGGGGGGGDFTFLFGREKALLSSETSLIYQKVTLSKFKAKKGKKFAALSYYLITPI